MPVIKANAYGLGAGVVAEILEKKFSETQMPYLVVARVGEARALREQGLSRRLLVLSHFSREDLFNWPSNTDLVLNSEADLGVLRQTHAALPKVHFNLNSGMNRLGFSLKNSNLLKTLTNFVMETRVEVSGLMSHLACAEADPSLLSTQQEKLFVDFVKALRSEWSNRGFEFPKWVHLSNSPGILAGVGQLSVCNAARPGLHLWGVWDTAANKTQHSLQLVPRVQAPLRQIFWLEAGESLGYGHIYTCQSRSLIGSVPLGYADGVTRVFSNPQSKSDVAFWIDGVRVPIVGRLSMDMTTVDLSQHPRASEWAASLSRGQMPEPPESEIIAEWIGPSQRPEKIADALGTISYEVLCSMGARLPRRRVT